jgi:hypothetical protein
MPSYLPMNQIRSMSYADLERWWEVDFDVLTSTAVAEATGPVQPSVVQALSSDDWIEQWADALYAGSGELKSSAERMEYTRDKRLETTQKRSGLVAQRLGHVNGLLRRQRKAQGVGMVPDNQKDARGMCLSLLSKYYKEEGRQLAVEEIARRGLAPHHPFWDAHYETKFDAIEDAIQRGVLQPSITPEARALLDMPAAALTSRVALDATQQENRCAELRHPLLLRGWTNALEHLRDRHCELAGLEPTFTVTLPNLDIRKLREMTADEAWAIINRRRFIRALAQRYRECEMLVREITRAVAVRRGEIEAPWYEAVGASREELARRHPEEMKALLTAFEPFCVPGSTQIRSNLLGRGGEVKGQLVPALKQALAEGTWRNLLA